MHFRIQSLLCWAVLLGFATAVQNNNQRSNSDLIINDDSAIEGSGYNGEVTHDLESSGSGYGPDDEDDPSEEKIKIAKPRIIVEPSPPKSTSESELTNKEKSIPNTTTDPTVKMNPKADDRPTSFFAQPGIIAAVAGGAVVGLLCAILVVMFIVYRMRKKDEGSYALGEPKQSPNSNSYSRTTTNKEFYA
ncbi:unnamed protein product [Psylliodes chrysocephalus]|uniref:Syndecan n=1 Tax=Psylliodes chrysocephalus TaxID=3402493 RepID=A0A9P0CMK7_9CUCU|nr:unnamed protein product [Psylliodes chrysocephala]